MKYTQRDVAERLDYVDNMGELEDERKAKIETITKRAKDIAEIVIATLVVAVLIVMVDVLLKG